MNKYIVAYIFYMNVFGYNKHSFKQTSSIHQSCIRKMHYTDCSDNPCCGNCMYKLKRHNVELCMYGALDEYYKH